MARGDAELGGTESAGAIGSDGLSGLGDDGIGPLLGQPEAEARAVRHSRKCRSSISATTVVGLILLAAVAVCRSLPRRTLDQSRVSATPILEEEEAEKEGEEDKKKCEMEDGVDYETKKALFAMQGILKASICRQKCREDSRCGAWTWGKTRDEWGLTNMCFLKALDMDSKPIRHSNDKVVSGLPCREKGHAVQQKKGLTPPSSTLTNIFDVDSLMPTKHSHKHTRGVCWCFALMLPDSYEQGLLKMQFKTKSNIFGCEGYAVYSSGAFKLAEGLETRVVDSDLKCDKGGEFGTALNTEIFMAVWKQVITDMDFDDYLWTVKADPDTVFIASRLLNIVKDIDDSEDGVYLNNCRMGMHGPLEVFSREAIWSWGHGAKRCFIHFYNLCSGPCLWGEDMFVDQCLSRVLHVKRLNIFNLLTEDHCDPPEGWKDCKNDSSVAFHPFKELEDWDTCLQNAMHSSSEKQRHKAVASEVRKDDASRNGTAADKAKQNGTAADKDNETATKSNGTRGSGEEDKEGKRHKDGKGDHDEEPEEEPEEEKEDDDDDVQKEEATRGSCQPEDGLDFETKKALFAMEGIVSAHLCRKKCEGVRGCGAWTWGKTRDVWGLTNTCFLKILEEGEKPKKHKNPKVVSGLPCRRPADKTSAGRKSLEPSKAMLSTFDLPHGGTDQSRHRKHLGELFCWALMLPHSYEQGLLAWQYNSQVNLFGCDAYAVYSNKSIEIAKGLNTSVVNTSLQCQMGGEFGTALNTDIFMRVWKEVIRDGVFEHYTWTVKCDPDTVFFADRLRVILEVYRETDDGVYLLNCRLGLHGPLEVFSRNAVLAFGSGSQKCFHHFYKLCRGPCLWGEDMFIDQCLQKVLMVRRVLVEHLLTEDHCNPPTGWDSCEDDQAIAFHPFKKLEDYKACVNHSLASHRG